MTEKENNVAEYKKLALQFANALASRKYAVAYALTSSEFKKKNSLAEMQKSCESMLSIYPTQEITHVEIFELEEAMTDWRGKQPEDVGWVYVSVGNENVVEAVTVVVTKEDEQLKIREVEFGRP